MSEEELKVAMLMAIRGENTTLALSPEQFEIATQMRADEVMHKTDYEGLADGIALIMGLLGD